MVNKSSFKILYLLFLDIFKRLRMMRGSYERRGWVWGEAGDETNLNQQTDDSTKHSFLQTYD